MFLIYSGDLVLVSPGHPEVERGEEDGRESQHQHPHDVVGGVCLCVL